MVDHKFIMVWNAVILISMIFLCINVSIWFLLMMMLFEFEK
jgi:hypothetical protein